MTKGRMAESITVIDLRYFKGLLLNLDMHNWISNDLLL